MKILLSIGFSAMTALCTANLAQAQASADAAGLENPSETAATQAQDQEQRRLLREQRQARRQEIQKRMEGLSEEQRQAVRERRQQRQAERQQDGQRKRPVPPVRQRPPQQTPPAGDEDAA